jgi:hypothetical protein
MAPSEVQYRMASNIPISVSQMTMEMFCLSRQKRRFQHSHCELFINI